MDFIVEGIIDWEWIKFFVDMVWKGFVIEMEIDVMCWESVDLMWIGNKVVVENLDGIDMSGIVMILMKFVGFVFYESFDILGFMVYNLGFDMYYLIIYFFQGFVWIIVFENIRVS